MARTKALGGWLQESKGKEKQRKVSRTSKESEMAGAELVAWSVRGGLWAASWAIAVIGNSTGKVIDSIDLRR